MPIHSIAIICQLCKLHFFELPCFHIKFVLHPVCASLNRFDVRSENNSSDRKREPVKLFLISCTAMHTSAGIANNRTQNLAVGNSVVERGWQYLCKKMQRTDSVAQFEQSKAGHQQWTHFLPRSAGGGAGGDLRAGPGFIAGPTL